MATRRQLCFSRLEDEKLIELVRSNPPLYVLQSADYKNKKMKEIIWNKIGDEMDRNSEECKTRWKNIRDNYHRKPKFMKMDTVSSVASEQPQNGKLETLRFLDSSSSQRRPQTTNNQLVVEPQLLKPPKRPPLLLTIAGTDTGTVIAHSISNVEHTLIDQFTDHTKFLREESQSESASVVPDLETSTAELKGSIGPIIKKRITFDRDKEIIKHIRESPKDRVTLVCNKNDQMIQQNSSSGNSLSKESGDHLDMFFKAMAATVRNFPPNHIIEAKRKVFMMINDMESSLGRIAPGRELSFLASSPVKSEMSSSDSELSSPAESHARFFAAFNAESQPGNRVMVVSQQVLSPGIIEQYLETNLSQQSQPPFE